MQLRERLRPRQVQEQERALPALVTAPATEAEPGLPRAHRASRLGGWGVQTWGRYAPGVLAVLTLGLLVRLPGLLADPLDTPGPQQAALAAFVRGLGIGPGHGLVALPWQGPVPLDLTGGLPLYAWATALLSSLTPGQAWPGRVLSLLTSLLAAGLLFAIVRRLKGGRAGVYAALFLTLSPLGLYYGRAYLPDAMNWLVSLLAVGAALRWRDSCMAARPRTWLWFALATGAAGLAIASAPGNLAFVLPLLYIAWPRLDYDPDYEERVMLDPLHARVVAFAGRRELLVYGLGALLPLLVWQVLLRVGGTATATEWGLGGPGAVLALLTDGSFYTLLLDQVVNNLLTVLGFLLVLAGLGQRMRAPWPLLLQVWLGGALLGLLLQAPRLAADESALTPLLLPLAALAGVGAAWLATLPAQIASVLRGSESGLEEVTDGAAEFTAASTAAAVTPRPARGAVRRQGWEAADPTGAEAARQAATRRLQDRLLVLGHLAVVLGLVGVVWAGLPRLLAHYQADPMATLYAAAGRRVAAAGGPERRLVVAGPGAATIFYASGLTGWAVPAEEFTRARLDALHQQGAGLLASADQPWLGRQPDYPGLLASFQVAILDKGFIVFDLSTAPVTSDRLYFLETGHTLRGGFRDFWEANGGLPQFGYPLTEELQLPGPEDGVVRTTQVFERAVFELHDDTHTVLLAPLGRWLTKDRPGWKPIPALPDSPDHKYFPETGHSIHGGFLETWLGRGGLPLFGYPISEEVREIDPTDGKVHTVQYFERARFELHPEAQGTPNYIQLGLVGKEWWEQRK